MPLDGRGPDVLALGSREGAHRDDDALALALGGCHGRGAVVVGDPHAGVHRLVGSQAHVAGTVAPVRVGHPALERGHELVEVVRAPFGEGAPGPQAGVLPAELVPVLEPGGGVGGPPHPWVLDVGVVGRAVPPDEDAVDAVAEDAQGAAVLDPGTGLEHRVHLAEERVARPRGRDPQREGLLARERAGRERGVQGAVAVGVELVDDVGAGVEPVLEGGVGD